MAHIGPVKQPIALLMGRTDAGDETPKQAQRLGDQPVFSPKSNRRSPWQYDGLLYRRRNEIERLSASKAVSTCLHTIQSARRHL